MHASIKATGLLVRRKFEKWQTLGDLTIKLGDEVLFECKTLELPWKNNVIRKSSIPLGGYKVRERNSQKFGDHFWVKNVKGRTCILIHAGNFHSQILGCILVGESFADIDGDKKTDIVNSQKTLNALIKSAPWGFQLTIENEKV